MINMTTHEAYQYDNYNGLISLNSILKDFECSDYVFDSLLSVINEEDEFVKKNKQLYAIVFYLSLIVSVGFIVFGILIPFIITNFLPSPATFFQ